MTNEIRDNLAGDTFHDGVHWTIIDQDRYVIKDENIDLIVGHHIFNPTVPNNNYWGDTNGVGTTRRNSTATSDKEDF